MEVSQSSAQSVPAEIPANSDAHGGKQPRKRNRNRQGSKRGAEFVYVPKSGSMASADFDSVSAGGVSSADEPTPKGAHADAFSASMAGGSAASASTSVASAVGDSGLPPVQRKPRQRKNKAARLDTNNPDSVNNASQSTHPTQPSEASSSVAQDVASTAQSANPSRKKADKGKERVRNNNARGKGKAQNPSALKDVASSSSNPSQPTSPTASASVTSDAVAGQQIAMVDGGYVVIVNSGPQREGEPAGASGGDSGEFQQPKRKNRRGLRSHQKNQTVTKEDDDTAGAIPSDAAATSVPPANAVAPVAQDGTSKEERHSAPATKAAAPSLTVSPPTSSAEPTVLQVVPVPDVAPANAAMPSPVGSGEGSSTLFIAAGAVAVVCVAGLLFLRSRK